jgi:Tol biopolymer transport system component
LRWFNRDGTSRGVAAPAAEYLDFELSPDNRAVAVSRLDEQQNTSDIWTIDLDRRTSTRLTSDRTNDASVVWSADGGRLAFRSNRRGMSDVFHMRSNSAGAEEVLLGFGANVVVTDWSAERLVFTNTRVSAGFDIWALPNGQAQAVSVVSTPTNAVHGRLSPDGKWLAYASDESGSWQVYVQPFPPSGAKTMISAEGGSEPRWRADGEELFFMSAAHEIMSVTLPRGNPFAPGVARVLFKTRVPLTGNVYRTNYDVSNDGQRFLVNVSTGERMTTPLTMILNWPALLGR